MPFLDWRVDTKQDINNVGSSSNALMGKNCMTLRRGEQKRVKREMTYLKDPRFKGKYDTDKQFFKADTKLQQKLKR